MGSSPIGRSMLDIQLAVTRLVMYKMVHDELGVVFILKWPPLRVARLRHDSDLDATVAQLVEHRPFKAGVDSSNLSSGTRGCS